MADPGSKNEKEIVIGLIYWRRINIYSYVPHHRIIYKFCFKITKTYNSKIVCGPVSKAVGMVTLQIKLCVEYSTIMLKWVVKEGKS